MQYLTFHWHNLPYGIEATLVQEIFPLPELNPITDATTTIMGLLNLRGQIVPILHLNRRSDSASKTCHLSDSIIILPWENLKIGLLVHQVNDVLELNPEEIETTLPCELKLDINTDLIAGMAQVNTDQLFLLTPDTLISEPDALLTLIWDAQTQLDGIAVAPNQAVKPEELPPSPSHPRFYDLYCPDATPEERAIFWQRANHLHQPIDSLKVTNEQRHLAVIGLGNEYFGLDLELVKEFTEISQLTPIPCCPTHIIGNMNLRGEIVTLVDIRPVLNLPTPSRGLGSHVVVVQVDDIVAGLPVDHLLDMAYLNLADRVTVSASDQGEQYRSGTAVFQEKILTILDLPKLFTQGKLVVNEQA